MTDYKETAKDIFKTAHVDWFESEDPFNKGNMVQGFMCKAEGLAYGSMLITHVNNAECLQIIRGSPKIAYPFDKLGRWNFPKAREILCYVKLDGTNILLFRYFDAKGYSFWSYKTRLMPFVRHSRFGDFLGMWLEMLAKYPGIPQLWKANGCNISFELYGARNHILVQYDVPLEIALLFGVKNNGEILGPRDLVVSDIPIVPLKAVIDSQYVETYKWHQEQMDKTLVEVEDGFKGEEGQVWYCYTDQGVVQFKCKPSQIEAIHFAAGKRIGKVSIITTCWNALENVDKLAYDFVAELLQEEFTPEQIDFSKDLILRCIAYVEEEAEFKAMVIKRYKEFGVNILADKVAVMRYLSQFFPKPKMKKVYSTIMANIQSV